ncbi:putative RNA methyltransferase [Paenibacillus sp. Pae15]
MSQFESTFRCPLCKSSMKIVDFKSLICSKQHTFDITNMDI